MIHLGSLQEWVQYEYKTFDVFGTTVNDVSLHPSKKGDTMIHVATEMGKFIGRYSERTHAYLLKKRGRQASIVLYRPKKGGSLLCSVDGVWDKVINKGYYA